MHPNIHQSLTLIIDVLQQSTEPILQSVRCLCYEYMASRVSCPWINDAQPRPTFLVAFHYTKTGVLHTFLHHPQTADAYL